MKILTYIIIFIIKFPYNAYSDWLKRRALSENRERVDDGKLAFLFDKSVDPKKTSSVTQTNPMETSYLSAVNVVPRDHC